jgi:hypothetical protein
MVRWLFSWEEAAERPWRTVISVFLLGFVAAGCFTGRSNADSPMNL